MSDQLLLRSRPTTVEAKRITAETREDVLAWLSQEVSAWAYGMRGVTWHQDGVMHDAFIGDWVVKNPWGEYHPVSDAALFSRYESVLPGVSE
jgi:hypothetical protein